MNLEDYLAVSKLPGVYKLVGNRPNGLIIEDLDTGKRKFVSARKHMFTPLATVSIYTEEDSQELSKIFDTMLDKAHELSPGEAFDSNQSMVDYFEQILPDYDQDRVFIGDIKKVIKWFNFLHQRNLLNASNDEEE